MSGEWLVIQTIEIATHRKLRVLLGGKSRPMWGCGLSHAPTASDADAIETNSCFVYTIQQTDFGHTATSSPRTVPIVVCWQTTN